MAQSTDTEAPVLDDPQVDNISQQDGIIDQLPGLSLDLNDSEIISNLNARIKDSEDYWNKATGFNLTKVRNENERFSMGKVNETGLYKHQKPYKENQIYIAKESILSYVAAQIAPVKAIPASKEPQSKVFAANLEKYITAHGEDIVDLDALLELAADHILDKRIAIWKLHYDESYGEHGEIITEAVQPDEVTLDKNARLGSNPEFICHYLKGSAEKLISLWPEKEKEILRVCGIKRRGPVNMTREIVYREVWVTEYIKNEAVEGVIWYFNDLVLEKKKNPNWLYTKPELNFLEAPRKPFIFGNLNNDGKHLIDKTSPLEQAKGMQEYLNKRGRQIGENADKANGLLIISTDSGLTKGDAQDLTGDPNQKIIIKTNGQAVEQLVHQLQAQILPPYVIQDKMDARMQIGNIMGAPTDFTGANDADDGDEALGQTMLKKNQAAGRQDRMVRALTRMLKHYYQFLTQMMTVWYTEEHTLTHDANGDDFDIITMKRGLIEKGMRIKAAKPKNPDSTRLQAITLQLVKADKIAMLDAYRELGYDDPQGLYDNWAKQQSDPMSLAREALDTIDESEAYLAYYDIMDGEKPELPKNPSKEYILTLRKIMISDDFLHPEDKAKKKYQKVFIKFVNDCIDSLEYRMALDEASDVSPDSLRPGTPLPQPGAAAPPGLGGAPGMPPGPMGPGAGGPPLPPMGGMPGPGGPMGAMPPGGMMNRPAPTPSSVFGGTGIPSPGAGGPISQPGNPASLPMV